jgi:hypothetical protein
MESMDKNCIGEEPKVAPGIWLMCAEMVIKNEIEQGIPQKGVALTYALAMRSQDAGASSPDWKAINDAITAKWGIKGLSRIKSRAWALYEGRIQP